MPLSDFLKLTKVVHGSNGEDGNDEEIVNDSEGEMETGDEDNENIGQDETEIEIGDKGNDYIDQQFQLISDNISMGHQAGDNIDGYEVENSHDMRGHLTDNLGGIGTQGEGDMIARDDVDDTSASSPQANLPTPGTNSPIATPDDLEPQPLGGPAREANAMEDGSLTITDPLQDEARRQDVDQTPPSSPDIYSTVRSFVDLEKPQLEYAAKQLTNRQKRFEEAESILAGLDKLEKEDAVKRTNIKGFINEDAEAQAEWNSWLGLTSDENISVEECLSRAKSSILDAKERKTKRQAEESEIAKNENKRAKLKADFKQLQAAAANREPSLPIRSLESF
ncbi:hypothetical protein THAR02_02520 [Trichoderma harzianum]|uniref:Uncharacterized protein n=1 Tax=Trichoderma harzianum TaxID=5544 RepID=A0A0F9XLP9_TRIHA|nr:hypothetical protein THAR02_02520 [Trichoderma harzianum]